MRTKRGLQLVRLRDSEHRIFKCFYTEKILETYDAFFVIKIKASIFQ